MDYEVQPSRRPGIVETFDSWLRSDNLHTVTIQYLGTGQNAQESAADGDPYNAEDLAAMEGGEDLLHAILDDFYKPGKKLQARATWLGDDGKPDRQRTKRKRIPMRKARGVAAGGGALGGGGAAAVQHLAGAVTTQATAATERHDKMAEARDGLAMKLVEQAQSHGEQRLADVMPLVAFAQEQQLLAQRAQFDATMQVWEAQIAGDSDRMGWADVAYEFAANTDFSQLMPALAGLVMMFGQKIQAQTQLVQLEAQLAHAKLAELQAVEVEDEQL
jgi:hypothetical protein